MFYVKIKNFKAYKQSDWIKLAPLTLIYGVNSSGKSAVIQSCRLISSLLRTITRPTSLSYPQRRRFAQPQDRGTRRSPLMIPLSGPDETGQIFDFGDYQQIVFGQDRKKTISFSVRYAPNSDVDKSVFATSFRIPAPTFEHKLEATLGGVKEDPMSARIECLKFSSKAAPVGRYLWRAIFEEDNPHELDEIEHRFDDKEASKKIADLIPNGLDEFVLPLCEFDLEAVDTDKIEIPRKRGRLEAHLFEISEESIRSLEAALEPLITNFFPEKTNWFKSNKRFFVSLSRSGYGGVYCVDKTTAERSEKSPDDIWADFPDELEIEDHIPGKSKKSQKIKLRLVTSPRDFLWPDAEDDPSGTEIDDGFMTAQLIRGLCIASLRLYEMKFGNTNHIPGFRGQPARYEGALDNRTSPLSASLAYLAENPTTLDLVLQDLEKLGIDLIANPQSARFAGARLDSFDFKPSGDQGIILTLADMGFGISQIIPILTAIRQRSGALSHTLIEEPEAHLHPSLQGNLMEHFAINSRARIREAFADLENQDPPSRLLERHDFVIETHSENLVTRLQKLIDQGKINNQHVSVVFCDQKDGVASTKEIKISSTGQLMDPWPNDFIEPLFDDL